MAQSHETVVLPKPSIAGEHSLEALLQQRRSVRAYRDAALSLPELGQLLWAAQGINHPEGLRTAPSAGALYPLELYVATGNVERLVPAIYHYRSQDHALNKVIEGDLRKTLARAALNQSWLADAAAVVIFTAVVERTIRKYGKRGNRYVDIEIGHAAQNLFLQAAALGLGTVVVGAFDDDDVTHTLQLPADTKPLILMPVGKPR
jgi:SagB-type dehydrogenase family enzyme